MVRNGVPLYPAVWHGRTSGPGYIVPALKVEVMVDGPDSALVLSTIGPSVRAKALTAGPAPPPRSWPRVSFAGLAFNAPPTWPVGRTNYVFDCGLEQDEVALPSPPQVLLDTDSNGLALPCPYFPPPRVAANGLVVDAGSGKTRDEVPPGAALLRVNGLQAFIDPTAVLSVLVLEVEVPGRARPVRLHIGLGSALTVERLLGSLERG